MKLKVFCYLTSQYRRHGVKSVADKVAQTAAVKNQLSKFLKDNSESSEDSKEESKARTARPYGSNLKGTNTHYFMKGESFTLDSESDDYQGQVAVWEGIITRITNIATRLEARPQYDISKKKEEYKEAKDKAFSEIMGNALSVSLNAEQKRALDAKLNHYTFGYYESHLMITIICDEYIDSLSHCVQSTSTKEGEYVYHIRSKRIITAKLLSEQVLNELDESSSTLIKLLPSKEATRFKTTLYKVIDGHGTVTGYKRTLEKLE